MDNKNKNFCAYCGRELKLIDSKYFDTKTGKKKKKSNHAL